MPRPDVPARTAFSDEHALQLEKWIDEMDAALPPLRNFILPSGGLASCSLHIARSVGAFLSILVDDKVCRRAERSVATLYRAGSVDSEAYKFLNRLASTHKTPVTALGSATSSLCLPDMLP